MWAVFVKMVDGAWLLHAMTIHEEFVTEIEEAAEENEAVVKVKVVNLED